ncbi:hypothetical protein [Haloferula sp.]|uniref:hypothetical protein n=1 Tax=Haloferula sp. TaxID=2497595 RepID=UPI003C753564
MNPISLSPLALVGLTAIALAQEPEPSQERPPLKPLPYELVEKFDTNKDGAVGRTERAAQNEAIITAMQERRKFLIRKYDLNQNGEIDKDEAMAIFVATWDKDGDGALSQPEKKASKEARDRQKAVLATEN